MTIRENHLDEAHRLIELSEALTAVSDLAFGQWRDGGREDRSKYEEASHYRQAAGNAAQLATAHAVLAQRDY